ncbi:transglutaminase-like domain-containing protein [Cellulomonas endophytica]|uniref:transglutaminase-like domain-containing protein n=1 Tax=Cellulomonas endophytica TaxID=2494735 RepID=UPI00101381CE|nr:transglutaminase family protein [Cellulomonas endophytica]
MRRSVTSHLVLDVQAPAELVLAVAVADGAWEREERLDVRGEAAPLAVREVKAPHGGRLHRVDAPAGLVVVDYRAVVTGDAGPPAADELDLEEYRRPSRYADSDRLLSFALDQFSGLTGGALADAVVAWVGRHVQYWPGSSLPTDGATDTLLARRGVCRDFAHLVVAMLRARDVPARLAAVYAPGLKPMDFHAVAEAWVDGGWRVLDATGMAPRPSLVRIMTGRDATDTAFLSTYGGAVRLRSMTVTAVALDGLPDDDGTGVVELR